MLIKFFIFSLLYLIASVFLPGMWHAFKVADLAEIDPSYYFYTATAVITILSIRYPKKAIMPLIGLFLLFMAQYHYFALVDKGQEGVVFTYVFLASLSVAAGYCFLYDILWALRILYDMCNVVFLPIKQPAWGDQHYKNTKEKGDHLEEFVRNVYKKLHGNAEKNGGSGDQGADLVVNLRNGKKLVIQCKNYSKPIGNSAVQEIVCAKAHYNADELAIVAPAGFTKGCRELAKSSSEHFGVRIELIDQNGLDQLVKMTSLAA